tara:strand:+ start:1047 stop:2372 length:1326 start_codon:yes stop_codon:yes gene_type:complete
MKILIFLIFQMMLLSCSFDNKSGIWQNLNQPQDKEKNIFSDFKNLSSEKSNFKEIFDLKQNLEFLLPEKIEVKIWKDIYYKESNNLENFKYNNLNKIVFKSKRVSKNRIENYILYKNNIIIFNDLKGNIYLYSLQEKKLLDKFNFYKKKYKSINKKINLIVDENIIFVSDNIGYLYAYNFEKNKIIWAKNYKVPFRSNMKIFKDKLIASNQNNDLYFFNKGTGDIKKLIPTEETAVKNMFINNLSLKNKTLFYINTYGSLYSIDCQDMNINWFVNLNQSVDINPSNLFYGNQIVSNINRVVISSNQFTYILDSETGSVVSKKNYSSKIKPLIVDKYLYLISNNDLLIMTNINSGEVLFSLDLNQEISNFLKTKKKKAQFKNIMFINDKIYIFLKNSYVLKFELAGKIKEIVKLPNRINTFPIIINNSILYLDQKNKISVVN